MKKLTNKNDEFRDPRNLPIPPRSRRAWWSLKKLYLKIFEDFDTTCHNISVQFCCTLVIYYLSDSKWNQENRITVYISQRFTKIVVNLMLLSFNKTSNKCLKNKITEMRFKSEKTVSYTGWPFLKLTLLYPII